MVLPSMTTIGLIGSGHIGSTVARLAVDAGHDVVLSNSRGPETLTDLVDELGPHARAATAAEAAAAGDIVVVTVPLKAYLDVPVEPLRGKVVIDTNNYYPQRDGHIAELDDESTTVSELLQAHLPESHVVKAFNNIYFGHLGTLQRPSGRPGALGARDRRRRRRRQEAGDRRSSTSSATTPTTSGPLAEGWRYQRDTAAYAGLYAPEGSGWPPPAGRQVTADFLREKLDAAVRYREDRARGRQGLTVGANVRPRARPGHGRPAPDWPSLRWHDHHRGEPRTALVTGASSGIGRATAQAAASTAGTAWSAPAATPTRSPTRPTGWRVSATARSTCVTAASIDGFAGALVRRGHPRRHPGQQRRRVAERPARGDPARRARAAVPGQRARARCT